MTQKKTNYILMNLIGIVKALIILLIIAFIISGIYGLGLIYKTNVKLKTVSNQVAEYFAHDIKNNDSFDFNKYSDRLNMNSLLKDDIQIILFEEDTSLLTSVKNESDKTIKADTKIWKTVKSGKDYFTKKTKINGKDYCVYCTPVFIDTDVYGMAFAGMPYENIQSAFVKAFFIIYGLLVIWNIICLVRTII